jgi:hypothetical protein
MGVSFRVARWADQAASLRSSTPPRTIYGVIPKLVLGEWVVGRIVASVGLIL